MSEAEKIEQKGTAAVKQLRLQNLAKGLPFMINDNDLPVGQCYIEYPNGIIQLVTLSTAGRDFDVIRDLSEKEGLALRMKYKLAG